MKIPYVLIMLIIMVPLYASFTVHTPDKLSRITGKYPYVLVLFDSDAQCDKKNKEYRHILQQRERDLKAVAQDYFFRQSDLKCVRVNVSKGSFDSVLSNANVSQLPAYVLYERGQPLTGAGPLEGMVYQADVYNFVLNNLQDQLQAVVDKKDEERDRRLQEAQIQFYRTPYWCGYGCLPYGPYYGGCYPWGWGGYGCGGYGYGGGCYPRSCVGVGFSFCR